MTRAWALAVAAIALAGCAARTPSRPTGPESSDPTAVGAFIQATRHCAGLGTVTAELRLSGHAGSERLRGTLHAGLAVPASVRIEAIAPFGPPFFILAGRDNRATLLLPRDERVLADAPVSDLFERLTGLALTAADLRLILTACLGDPPNPSNGRRFGNGWQAVSLSSGVVVYLKTNRGRPIVIAADHGQWYVDYAMEQRTWPQRVRIRSRSGEVDMTAALDQVEINTRIDGSAFEIAVPSNVTPMTLDHLKAVTPLKDKS